jgi:hypothetical protein
MAIFLRQPVMFRPCFPAMTREFPQPSDGSLRIRLKKFALLPALGSSVSRVSPFSQNPFLFLSRPADTREAPPQYRLNILNIKN